MAMAIMALAMGAIYAMEDASIQASTRAQEMTVVATLARNTMIDMEAKFEGKTFDEVKKEDGAKFEPPFEAYAWKSVIKEVEFPMINPMAGADGKKEEGDDPNSAMVEQLSKLITSYLSKAIREVTVTITWKKGTKEQSFSVATYWVNLNSEFKLSEQ
jgi:hypothetical protein